MPQEFITRAVVESVRKLPGYPRLEVLDLSCGKGEILRALADEGCAVRGTHYRPDDYKLSQDSGTTFLEGIGVDEGVDLTNPLPYPDGSFDVVILSEVVEHLPEYLTVIGESGRVLREEGWLVLSTPNIARLHSRLQFYWTGMHKLIRGRVGWDIPPAGLYAYHINPVDFPFLHTILHHAGLSVRRLGFTKFKARHSWLLLFYPVHRLLARIQTTRRGGNEERRRGERDLLRWMVHPAMLASEQLLVVARKTGGRESGLP